MLNTIRIALRQQRLLPDAGRDKQKKESPISMRKCTKATEEALGGTAVDVDESILDEDMEEPHVAP